ncbi:MAG: DNA replication/repair protein RecF [Chloroflexi bacterium]|nr:DNA replication/repair protein RecF [Chloroflexota bacterium]MDA1219645.1 DNA replication/repair protein RecF [Chloroflexota bacterium]
MAYLSRLSLINFRNFGELELDLPLGVVVFTGANAQGKTTLLEAVYLLALARSFRAENEREVISFSAGLNGEQALVRGIVEKKGQRLSVNVGYQSTATPGSTTASADGLGYSVRKQIRVNRIRYTAADLVGMVGAVLFSADDIELVYGAPSGRRRYLDILVSQADPPYIKALQRYQRVLQHRNHLLKMLREGRAEADELEFWNAELVREGGAITWQRQEVMKRLAVFCAEHHSELSESGDEFQIEYRPSVNGGDSLSSTEERFSESLAAFQQRELATATTVVGPHRDDFRLLVNGLDMGTFASRGEARTLALTLRLAEASYLSAARDDEPVVLLDDVLSEMDAARRRRVLEKVTRYQQSLITTTDLDLVQDYFGDQATYFKVADGQVLPHAKENPVEETG